MVHLGRGAWLAKVDILHAFRLCPVRPAQWPLLCFRWADRFFVDTRLPFGCRSSPCIFNSFAGALAWMFIHLAGVVYLLHYLDDFFFANRGYDLCSRDMLAIRSLCGYLGVPLAPGKSVGPSRCLTYLGIELDTWTMTARLPPDKLLKLRALLAQWHGKTKVKKRELLSLIGFLSFDGRSSSNRVLGRRVARVTVGCAWRHLDLVKGRVLANSLAPTTLKTYRAGFNQYLQFCCHLQLAPFPLREQVLAGSWLYGAEGWLSHIAGVLLCYPGV